MNFYRALAFLLITLVLPVTADAKVMPAEFDSGRNRLIAYMLSH